MQMSKEGATTQMAIAVISMLDQHPACTVRELQDHLAKIAISANEAQIWGIVRRLGKTGYALVRSGAGLDDRPWARRIYLTEKGRTRSLELANWMDSLLDGYHNQRTRA